ncbi:MAG: hypothetical protein OEW27_07260 [Aquincola sp.]|nr:hypothetical protein [Aquincola sp.]
MKKHLFVIACLALPLAALAANNKGGAKPPAAAASAAAKPASQPASQPARHARTADESRASVQASKQRKSDMGACQKQADDKRLRDVERKQFVAACMSGK